MKLSSIIAVVAGLLAFWLLAARVICVVNSYGEFEYRTTSGQTGTAEYCTVSYGQARCRTVDNKTVIVESYRKVK